MSYTILQTMLLPINNVVFSEIYQCENHDSYRNIALNETTTYKIFFYGTI